MIRLTPAVLLCLATTPVFADITAAQAWDLQLAYHEATGAAVDATLVADDGSVTVSDLTLTYALPFGIGSVVVERGGMVLTDGGDGTVAITHEGLIPLTISADLALWVPISLRAQMEVGLTGFTGTVEGDAQAATFYRHADMTTITVNSLTVTGLAFFDGTTADGSISIQDGSLETRVRDEQRHTSISTKAASEAVAVDMQYANRDGTGLHLTRSAEAARYDFLLNRPDVLTPDMTLAQALRDGFGFSFGITADYPKYELTETRGDVVVWQQTQTVDRVMLNTRILEDAVSAEYELIGVSVQEQVGLDGSAPLGVSLGHARLSAKLPVLPGDAPQDLLRVGVVVEGVTPSDSMWALFDPTQILPRDPISFSFGLFGKAIVLADFLDPAVWAGLIRDGTIPLDVTETPIFRLRLSGMGASIDANGDFTFDNSDRTIPVSQRTMGQMTVDMIGVPDLLDNLLTTSVVPSEWLASFRAFLDVFTTADETGLRTVVFEFERGGGFTVNGQPVP